MKQKPNKAIAVLLLMMLVIVSGCAKEAPAAPSEDVLLLREIRDSLKK